jgi:hypothetical protein
MEIFSGVVIWDGFVRALGAKAPGEPIDGWNLLSAGLMPVFSLYYWKLYKEERDRQDGSD